MIAFARIDKAAFHRTVRERREGRCEYVRGLVDQAAKTDRRGSFAVDDSNGSG
jgi:hypothetical protein